MIFDLPTVSALVQRLGSKLAPGWKLTCEIASSVEANAGALAMVFSTPERRMMHIIVAPHPPGESIEESVAHELAHGILSPLTKLIEWSPAAVMLEEQIVEHLGTLLATVPLGMARAISRAMANPRATSATVRARISALATRRRNQGRKRSMLDSKKLAELAMKAGELGAREDVPEEVRALLAEFVAAMAGGGGEEPEAPAAREEEPDPGKPGAPVMREEEVPEQMRAQMRAMKRTAAISLDATIRLRIHELRTVDKLGITPAIETRLRKATSVEDFEDRLELVKASLSSATETQRKRSNVQSSESNGNGAPSIASLLDEGMSEPLARSIHRAFEAGKEDGEIALGNARKRLPKKAGA
jgi:hypothetical protein